MLDDAIRTALEEDIGWGDVTTNLCVAENQKITGRFVAKEDILLCGVGVLHRTFVLLDERVSVTSGNYKDGDFIKKGEIIARISGPARPILSGERTALNLLQRLCAIAKNTHTIVEMVRKYPVKICDTRKTTPGLRSLEKYAVRIGGGTNHRMGLSDGILIKDNHIAAAGGIKKAIKLALNNAPHTLKVEVEVSNFSQIRDAIDAGADIIMLDNMTVEDMTEAVKLINHRAVVEASGNMGERDLIEVAKTGVDLISIGALTHTVAAADISLLIDKI